LNAYTDDNDLNIHVRGQSLFIFPSLELCLLGLNNSRVGLRPVRGWFPAIVSPTSIPSQVLSITMSLRANVTALPPTTQIGGDMRKSGKIEVDRRKSQIRSDQRREDQGRSSEQISKKI